MYSNNKLTKTQNINGEISVASSMNSIVKKQFTNMTEQYNVYASVINEMEEKIKALKSIMLSEEFLKKCQHFTLDSANTTNNKNTHKNNTGNGKAKGGHETTLNLVIKDESQDVVTDNNNNNNNNNNNDINNNKMNYFTPSQPNSLLWCFYIIWKGFAAYEYESNYFTAEQQFKIQTIEKVKKGENKSVFKENKISKTSFESGLMGNANISAKTLYALCICYNVNIFYVYKNTYYEMITSNEKPMHIIKYNNESNNYSLCILDCIPNEINMQICETPSEHKEYIDNIKLKYWKLDNLEKPLRSITTYSVNDLSNICSKLDIDTVCEKTNKKKTKAELYSSILEKL
jgi:hypothetical protein